MIVEVYRNLNRGGYSIRDRKTKKVIDYKDQITLKNVSFHVGEGGRQRVIRDGQKNVHAFIRGEIVDHVELKKKFTYLPYERGDFFDLKTGDSLESAKRVTLNLKGAFYE